ncbi:hypothetical protein PFISCL1PPCAC_9572, partial [Pristionchus fissidentatus]
LHLLHLLHGLHLNLLPSTGAKSGSGFLHITAHSRINARSFVVCVRFAQCFPCNLSQLLLGLEYLLSKEAVVLLLGIGSLPECLLSRSCVLNDVSNPLVVERRRMGTWHDRRHKAPTLIISCFDGDLGVPRLLDRWLSGSGHFGSLHLHCRFLHGMVDVIAGIDLDIGDLRLRCLYSRVGVGSSTSGAIHSNHLRRGRRSR